jgi:hypothetical protein
MTSNLPPARAASFLPGYESIFKGKGVGSVSENRNKRREKKRGDYLPGRKEDLHRKEAFASFPGVILR